MSNEQVPEKAVDASQEERHTKVDCILENWTVKDPEQLERVFELLHGIAIEYDRLTLREKERLPLWLFKALEEAGKGW